MLHTLPERYAFQDYTLGNEIHEVLHGQAADTESAVRLHVDQPLAGKTIKRLANDIEADAVGPGNGRNPQPLTRNEITTQKLRAQICEDPRYERTATFLGTHGPSPIGAECSCGFIYK